MKSLNLVSLLHKVNSRSYKNKDNCFILFNTSSSSALTMVSSGTRMLSIVFGVCFGTCKVTQKLLKPGITTLTWEKLCQLVQKIPRESISNIKAMFRNRPVKIWCSQCLHHRMSCELYYLLIILRHTKIENNITLYVLMRNSLKPNTCSSFQKNHTKYCLTFTICGFLLP